MNNDKEIHVFSKGYFALVAFFFFVFSALFGSFIYLYVIENREMGMASIVSVILMIIFGGLALFTYSMFGSKVYIFDEIIIAKKWYGRKVKFNISDIEEVVIEKSEGKIVTVSIISDDFRDRYTNEKLHFEDMTNYLIEKVDREKIKCYRIGTKKVIPL